jgi:hypothetical protein
METISSGSYGTVLKAKRKYDKLYFAIKEINTSNK